VYRVPSLQQLAEGIRSSASWVPHDGHFAAQVTWTERLIVSAGDIENLPVTALGQAYNGQEESGSVRDDARGSERRLLPRNAATPRNLAHWRGRPRRTE
jgi:hypothetical protein